MTDNQEEIDINEYCAKADSKALAAQVVVYRLLHINKELAKSCMEELTRRSNAGDQFDYEKYIEEKLASMPKPLDPEKRALIDRMLANSELRK
jgi:hypothetical protein